MTPALGTPGEPAPGGGRDGRERRARAAGVWATARWSYLYGDGHRATASASRDDRGAAASRRDARDRAAAGRRARAVHQGAGVDLGGAALLLVRRHRVGLVVRRAGRATWRATSDSAAVARKVALGALVPVAGAADHGPRPAGALPEHAADLQAALADVDGRVVPDRVRRPRPRRRSAPTCSGAGATARALGAANAVLGGYLGSYTGVLLAATAVPVWARSRLFLGPIFVCTATATGAAATRLALVGARACRRATRRARRSAASRPARWRPSWCCRRSTSAASARSPPGSSEGRPGRLFKAAKWARPRRAGAAARAPARRPADAPRRVSALPRRRAAVPLRLGRRRAAVGARRPRGRGDGAVAPARGLAAGERRRRCAGERQLRRVGGAGRPAEPASVEASCLSVV